MLEVIGVICVLGALAAACVLMMMGIARGAPRLNNWLKRFELPVSPQAIKRTKELKLGELYVSAERLRIRLKRVEGARVRCAERLGFWREIHDLLKQMGSRQYILDSLCFHPEDPLARWIATYIHGLDDPWTMTDSDEARAELVVAFEAQRRSWDLSEMKIQTELDDAESRIMSLEHELGVRMPLDPRDAKRQELQQLRVRVAEIETEILEEENRNASGPERLKHGIPTDD